MCRKATAGEDDGILKRCHIYSWHKTGVFATEPVVSGLAFVSVCDIILFGLQPPSSSGPGHWPFKPEAGVRIPLGAPKVGA